MQISWPLIDFKNFPIIPRLPLCPHRMPFSWSASAFAEGAQKQLVEKFTCNRLCVLFTNGKLLWCCNAIRDLLINSILCPLNIKGFAKSVSGVIHNIFAYCNHCLLQTMGSDDDWSTAQGNLIIWKAHSEPPSAQWIKWIYSSEKMIWNERTEEENYTCNVMKFSAREAWEGEETFF